MIAVNAGRPRVVLSALGALALMLALMGAWAPAQAQQECTAPAWNASTDYVPDDVVSHNGNEWLSTWWSQGAEPGDPNSWAAWEDQGPCDDDGGGGEPEDPPATPTGLQVTGTTTSSVSLSWSASTGAADYQVERDGQIVGTTTSTTFTDSDLSPSTTFTYRVRARNQHGNSSFSSAVQATTQSDGGGGGECTAPAWNLSQIYTTGDVVSHNGFKWTAGHWTQGDEPGTHPDTVWGPWRNPQECDDDGGDPEPEEPPPTPAGLQVTGTTSSGVSLSWSASSGADDYQVERNGQIVGTTTNTSFTDPGLPHSTTFTYRVRARNQHGNSDWSTAVQGATREPDDGGTFVDRRVAYFIQWGIYANGGRDFHLRDALENGTLERLTHINYAFGNVNADGECFMVNQAGEGDSWADYQRRVPAHESVDGVADTFDQELAGNFNQLRKVKEMFPNIRVYISLGGWTWSKNFSDAALTPQSRANFVESCIDLYLRGNLPIFGGDPQGGLGSAFGVFDGIDLDWEWPASEGHPDNTVRPEDKQNFTALVAEFRSQLNALEAETGRTYDLTAFVPADPAKIDLGFEVPQLMPNFDFVTVQGYDLAGAWDPLTMHQANLFNTPGDPRPAVWSVDTAIQAYLDRGAPPDKLVMGVPFYGRGWQGVPAGPNGNGLMQQSTGGAAPGQFEDGNNDYKLLVTRPGQRFRDTQTGALWLYDGNEFWTYDDPQQMLQKAAYVKDRGLGGMMMWELSGDNGDLIQAIDQGLN